jgi:hypothetical protein
LFVAFTTSFAFSPTDTLPLTRRAKMLMLLQAAISVVTLTGVAGSAIKYSRRSQVMPFVGPAPGVLGGRTPVDDSQIAHNSNMLKRQGL